MAALTPEQLATLPPLPRPPGPFVQLVDPKTGKPTSAMTDWLAKLAEYNARLLQLLGED